MGKIPFELNEHTKWILGRPNFTCGMIADMLRKDRRDIPKKAEEEQAAVIYWMLELYFLHGENWRAEADKELIRIEKA
jgi:hypothetical protein